MAEGILCGLGFVKSELIFDNDEFSIQRRIAGLVLVTIGSCFLSFVFILALFYSLRLPKFIVYASVYLCLNLCLYLLFWTFNYRKKNTKIYTYSNIRSLKINKLGGNIIQLQFDFNYGYTDCFKTRMSTDFLRFAQLLPQNSDFPTENPENTSDWFEMRTIKLSNEIPSELQYDSKFFCFNYNTSTFLVSFFSLPILLVSISETRNLVGMLLGLLIVGYLVYCIVKYVKYKRATNIAYEYSEIDKVEVDVIKSKCSMVTFRFKNGKCSKVKILDQSKLQMFIQVLDVNKVPIHSKQLDQ